MTLEQADALEFINGYSALLLMIEEASSELPADQSLLQILYACRERLSANPGLLDSAIARIKEEALEVPEEVIEAVRTLEVGKWIYLRDTRSYSIFLDVHATDAYAVIGLTERIRDVTGNSGVILMTGVMCYKGRYVCDGIVSVIAILGRNYRRSFTDSFRELKATGRFHVKCG